MLHSLIALVVLSGGVAAQPQNDAVLQAQQDVAVETAARAYRIATYESFHGQRQAYNMRADLADRVLNAWIDAGRPGQFTPEVVTWFETARQSNTLPQLPECISELQSLAAELEASATELTGAQPSVKRFPVSPIQAPAVESVTTQTPTEPVTAEQSLAPTMSHDTTSFLEGMGRSILRATISASDDNDSKRFD